MKRISLIRHAKSSWNLPSEDINRPLAHRGISDANMMAVKIGEYLPSKNLIWSSTAIRARDTALIFSQNLRWATEDILFKNELYTFDVKSLTDTIRLCDNSYDNVILFGHNAAITDFVNTFGDKDIDNVPTCGFVQIVFDTNHWENILNGKIVKTVFPKEFKI